MSSIHPPPRGSMPIAVFLLLLALASAQVPDVQVSTVAHFQPILSTKPRSNHSHPDFRIHTTRPSLPDNGHVYLAASLTGAAAELNLPASLPSIDANATNISHLFALKYGPLSSVSGTAAAPSHNTSPSLEWVVPIPTLNSSRILHLLPKPDGSGAIIIGLFEQTILFPATNGTFLVHQADKDGISLFVSDLSRLGSFSWAQSFSLLKNNPTLKHSVPLSCGATFMEETGIGGAGNLLIVGSYHGSLKAKNILNSPSDAFSSFFIMLDWKANGTILADMDGIVPATWQLPDDSLTSLEALQTRPPTTNHTATSSNNTNYHTDASGLTRLSPQADVSHAPKAAGLALDRHDWSAADTHTLPPTSAGNIIPPRLASRAVIREKYGQPATSLRAFLVRLEPYYARTDKSWAFQGMAIVSPYAEKQNASTGHDTYIYTGGTTTLLGRVDPNAIGLEMAKLVSLRIAKLDPNNVRNASETGSCVTFMSGLYNSTNGSSDFTLPASRTGDTTRLSRFIAAFYPNGLLRWAHTIPPNVLNNSVIAKSRQTLSMEIGPSSQVVNIESIWLGGMIHITQEDASAAGLVAEGLFLGATSSGNAAMVELSLGTGGVKNVYRITCPSLPFVNATFTDLQVQPIPKNMGWFVIAGEAENRLNEKPDGRSSAVWLAKLPGAPALQVGSELPDSGAVDKDAGTPTYTERADPTAPRNEHAPRTRSSFKSTAAPATVVMDNATIIQAPLKGNQSRSTQSPTALTSSATSPILSSASTAIPSKAPSHEPSNAGAAATPVPIETPTPTNEKGQDAGQGEGDDNDSDAIAYFDWLGLGADDNAAGFAVIALLIGFTAVAYCWCRKPLPADADFLTSAGDVPADEHDFDDENAPVLKSESFPSRPNFTSSGTRRPAPGGGILGALSRAVGVSNADSERGDYVAMEPLPYGAGDDLQAGYGNSRHTRNSSTLSRNGVGPMKLSAMRQIPQNNPSSDGNGSSALTESLSIKADPSLTPVTSSSAAFTPRAKKENLPGYKSPEKDPMDEFDFEGDWGKW
ncbi:hypothetical protein SeLEV6574_g05194 [Synchytrium endobioticum]|uniref:Uncharacterized protein n=1 Tax=Synchytrium endobioticum TaxID=286115 RepID=A0A507CVG3_9FUNG|nr:hypothetical protein SeLEV6574_g05194 [Synchytrium endobioticum]